MVDVDAVGVVKGGGGAGGDGDVRVVLDDSFGPGELEALALSAHVDVTYRRAEPGAGGLDRVGTMTCPVVGVEGHELLVRHLEVPDGTAVLGLRPDAGEPRNCVAALVASYADRLGRRDWEGLRRVLHPEVVFELPQTRERIRGRDAYLGFTKGYPGEWNVVPQVVLGNHEHGALLFRWSHDDRSPTLAVTFFEAIEGQLTKVTTFWPEPYDPPAGREHLVERY